MLYGFPYGCSKHTLKARNRQAHAVSDRFPCPQSQATWGSGQTHNACVFAFRIHLWHVASKYPANIKSGPLNPLNKHNEKPAANVQTIWNGTSLCVFLSWFILGCSSVCGLPITNSKTSSASYSSEWLWGFFSIFSDCKPFEYFVGFWWNTCRLCYILGHIWIQLTNQLHIFHFYNTLRLVHVWLVIGFIDVSSTKWLRVFPNLKTKS